MRKGKQKFENVVWGLPSVYISFSIVKKVSSSTSHKKNSETEKLRDFSFFFSSTLIYEPILIQISMNANRIKKPIFHKIKYDLKGYKRSHKVILKLKNIFFLRYVTSLTSILFKTFQECQHIRPPLCQNLSSTFVYGLILMEICMNANIMKTPEMSL